MIKDQISGNSCLEAQIRRVACSKIMLNQLIQIAAFNEPRFNDFGGFEVEPLVALGFKPIKKRIRH